MEKERPTQIVIFGGTGDLAKRKLLHALLDLFVRGYLPKQFYITGVASSELTDESYQELVRDLLNTHEHTHGANIITDFCQRIGYVSGNFNEDAVYAELNKKLTEQGGGDRIFYLAVPPKLYGLMFTKLSESALGKQSEKSGYARVLVEKPFGNDLTTAKKLDNELSSLFTEDQIFRIDHYLAKEAVQNILSFRFANTFFRSPWNKQHIESVHITMHETIDVGTRTSFYEGVGALRDVGQNHLLQLLALIAMEEPVALEASKIRAKRAETLEALRPETIETISENTYRAQYDGYTDSEKIEDESKTETYFHLTAYIDNKTWEGVPFQLSAGKGLAEAAVSIEIKFKDIATGPFETNTCHTTQNCIKLDISPEQAMSITLNAKAPGLGYQIESRTLSFNCANDENEIKNSYERVLLDALRGDQTLFTTTTEVLAAWRYITSVLNNWQETPLHKYEKGSTPKV